MFSGAFRSALGVRLRLPPACLTRTLSKQLSRPATTAVQKAPSRFHAARLHCRPFSTKGDTPTFRLPIIPPPSIGYWLMFSSTLVFAVIVVGGVTRLTESGLSITEWRPITGILPPLSQEEWMQEFGKYKATPEFKLYVTHITTSLYLFDENIG